jgi:hypothetical protein
VPRATARGVIVSPAMSSTPSRGVRVLLAVLGLGPGGRIFYRTLFVLAVPALLLWFVVLPRLRFSDHDEQLFRAARHGDVGGIERALAAGGHVDAASPVDGKTALFRAAIFGHGDAVRALLGHGANASARGSDGRTALEVTQAARAGEKDPAIARELDAVATMLRTSEAPR